MRVTRWFLGIRASLLLSAAVVPAISQVAVGQHNVGYFGRVTDTVSVNDHTVDTTQMTIEARFQIPTALAGAGGDIFHEQFGGQEDKSLDVSTGGIFGSAWAGYLNGQDDPGISAAVSISPGAWHQVAFVRDGAAQRLYLDGTLVAARDLAVGSFDRPIGNSASGVMALGALQFAPGGSTRSPAFRGLLDWVRVSDSARYAGASYAVPGSEPSPDALTQLLLDFNVPAGSTSIPSRVGTATGRFGAGFSGATQPLIAIPGDTNFDGSVNFADLVTLAQHYNSTTGEWATGDFTGDRRVNFADLLLLAQHYGQSDAPAAAVVPEPGLGALIGLAALLPRWRRPRA